MEEENKLKKNNKESTTQHDVFEERRVEGQCSSADNDGYAESTQY